ncbi:MAG: DUF262 domain-containing protein [Chlorobia bacterium]|nr:DUF262 domain-containing protein [Fimbriimonadaceae bacterium]
MSKTLHTKAESITIHELITTYNIASVPIYQRSYAWDSDELDEFWSDLQGVVTKVESTYFIGSIVLIAKAGTSVEIVDGQQRLTTLSLALCALRDGCKSVLDTERAAILSEYLGKKDFLSLKVEAKLSLNEENNGLYREILDEETNVAELELFVKDRKKPISNRRLAFAYIYLYKQFADFTSTFADKSKLTDCLFALVNRIEVVRILSQDDVSAYTLFETLNDRGVDLALADLLKNYLFMKSSSRIAEAKASWSEISTLIGRETLTQFIRHQWMSRNGLIRERDLYKKLKARIGTSAQVIEYLEELKADAQVYGEIGNLSSPVWNSYTKSERDSLKAVQVFGIRQCFPLILAAHSLKKPADREMVLRWMVSFLVRYSIIGERGTGNLETLYARTSVEVRSTPYKSSEVKRLFHELYPSDDEFKVNFTEKTLQKTDLIKYILASIEDKRSTGLEKIVNSEGLTVEHILPRTPVAGWGAKYAKGSKLHSALLWRLGNLTLLTSPMNEAVANDVFANKKKEYIKSELAITSELSKSVAWHEVTIDARQAVFASEAISIWCI